MELEGCAGFTDVIAVADGVVGDGEVVDVVCFGPGGEFGTEGEGCVGDCVRGYC